MKAWLTAAEIAAETLPGLPGTTKGVLLHAERQGWSDDLAHARKRAGRGGGTEYHVDLLPTLARLAYETRHRAVAASQPEPTCEPQPLAVPASERAAAEQAARLAIVTAADVFCRGTSLSRRAADHLFTERYNGRAVSIDAWILDLVPRLSTRSLARWRAAKSSGAQVRLAIDRSANRKGKGVLETANSGAVRRFVLALIAHQPHFSADQVRTQVRAEFGDRLTVVSKGIETAVDVPPVRTVQAFLARLKAEHKVELTKLSNPDRYRSTMALSGTGTLRHVTAPNQLWQIDASPVDALCTDGRHSVYACIDIATRRTLLYVSRTPRASAVCLLIRKAILAWGVPETIKVDNGSDFIAVETRRLFAALGIEVELSDAYSPQQKGHVERVIKSFQHQLATLLPGYVGHSVADRKAIEDRKSFADRLGQETAEAFDVQLTGAELQQICDEWIETVYQHRPHAGLQSRTPFEVAAATAGAVRIVEERALDVLLMPAAGRDGRRTVTKFGIRIDHLHYVAPTILPGTAVFVRQDPHDLGRVYAFSADQHAYLGEAVCAELSGLHPETFVKAAKELRSEILSARTAEIAKEIREIKKGPALYERAFEVARRDLPNVVALPKREERHETPEIRAALDVDRPAPAESGLSDRAAEIHVAMTAEAPASDRPSVTPLRVQETPQLRFRRALDLEARITAGEPVDPQEAVWLGGYQMGAEYRALKAMHEDFADFGA